MRHMPLLGSPRALCCFLRMENIELPAQFQVVVAEPEELYQLIFRGTGRKVDLLGENGALVPFSEIATHPLAEAIAASSVPVVAVVLTETAPEAAPDAEPSLLVSLLPEVYRHAMVNHPLLSATRKDANV